MLTFIFNIVSEWILEVFKVIFNTAEIANFTLGWVFVYIF